MGMNTGEQAVKSQSRETNTNTEVVKMMLIVDAIHASTQDQVTSMEQK